MNDTPSEWHLLPPCSVSGRREGGREGGREGESEGEEREQ